MGKRLPSQQSATYFGLGFPARRTSIRVLTQTRRTRTQPRNEPSRVHDYHVDPNCSRLRVRMHAVFMLRQPNSEYDRLEKVPLSNCQGLPLSHIRRGAWFALWQSCVNIIETAHKSKPRSRLLRWG